MLLGCNTSITSELTCEDGGVIATLRSPDNNLWYYWDVRPQWVYTCVFPSLQRSGRSHWSSCAICPRVKQVRPSSAPTTPVMTSRPPGSAARPPPGASVCPATRTTLCVTPNSSRSMWQRARGCLATAATSISVWVGVSVVCFVLIYYFL